MAEKRFFLHMLRKGAGWMRRIVALILALSMLVFVLPAFATTLGEDPDLFRDFIQNRYGIMIRMGNECKDCTITDCELLVAPDCLDYYTLFIQKI